MAGYIGTQPVPQATQTRDAFTATSNQTSFPTSGYTPEFLDVFLNGVKLAASDYTATNGSDVVLAAGATTGDILEVVSYGTFEVLNPTFDGNVTFTGNASFGDNDKAIFGDGSDLQIYHDGSNSYIKDAGTGSLRLRGTDLRLESSTLAHNFITCTEGGGVYVYHNDSSKLATTATGINVTGTVAATAYTGDGSNLTGVGSPSIDDNGNATAITIDSSENVLVGKTSSSTTTAGNELRAGGLAAFTRSGSYSLNLNRLSSDGDIAVFQKDGTTIGSIGATGGNTFIYGGSGSVANLNFGSTSVVYPSVDNVGDVGASSHRFKDAYLSGGVYLGGTGSANKLDDYEVGSWTPSLESAPGGISIANSVHNKYVKIGNIVHLQLYVALNTSSSSSAALMIAGLPFTPLTNQATAGSMIVRYGSSSTYAPYISGARIEFYRVNNTGNWSLMNYSNVSQFHAHIGITYQT